MIKMEIKESKWGKYVDYEEQMAFIEYSGQHKDFITGSKYVGEIFFSILFAKTPDRSCMEWTRLTADSVEDLINNPIFKEYSLKKEKIYPYFLSRPESKEI